MKTNVVLQSSDRELFGIIIKQETKTGFLNLSDLQNAYDKIRFKEGWKERRIDNIISSTEFKERCFYILEKQGLIKPCFQGDIEVADNQLVTNQSFKNFMNDVENNGITKVLKQSNAWVTKGARHTKTTWANPYIWVMIAMEMNPKMYAEVVVWLTDQLLINRIEAGNFCKVLNSSIQRFKPDGNDYKILACTLNKIVFGRHEIGIRNSATKEQLKELINIEEKMAFAIDMDYITSFSMLLKELRKLLKINK
jgi:uncharacterized protein YecT (DUF1311 family)